MKTPLEFQEIQFPLDRPVEVGRFVFASKGGAYRFMLEPKNEKFGGVVDYTATSWEIVAEWCEFGEPEPCDGGYDFWGGCRTFPTPNEALGAMYEFIARAALDEKHSLDLALQKEESQ